VAPTFTRHFDFYLCGSLKYRVYKTNPDTLEEPRHNIHCEIITISGEEQQDLTCSAETLSAFGQEGNIFSICCNTGLFLLNYIKVILTAIAYRIAPFTDSYPSRDAGFGARAAEGSAVACRTVRKKTSLYMEMRKLQRNCGLCENRM
jgi:hypothetical protein